MEAATETCPEEEWQRCVVHWYRNLFSHVPNSKGAELARMLKAIHAQDDRASAEAKGKEVAREWSRVRI